MDAIQGRGGRVSEADRRGDYGRNIPTTEATDEARLPAMKKKKIKSHDCCDSERSDNHRNADSGWIDIRGTQNRT